MYEHSRESNLITSIILLSPWIQHSLSFIMVTSQTLTLLKKLHNKKWHLVPFNYWLARMVHAEKTLCRIYQVPYLTFAVHCKDHTYTQLTSIQLQVSKTQLKQTVHPAQRAFLHHRVMYTEQHPSFVGVLTKKIDLEK